MLQGHAHVRSCTSGDGPHILRGMNHSKVRMRPCMAKARHGQPLAPPHLQSLPGHVEGLTLAGKDLGADARVLGQRLR